MEPQTEDLYEVLGVSRAASTAEIRAEYIRRVELCDPGKLTMPSEQQLAASAQMLSVLDEAWRVLGDPALRAAYDATRSGYSAPGQVRGPTGQSSPGPPGQFSPGPPGWYPARDGFGPLRWWTGHAWAEDQSPARPQSSVRSPGGSAAAYPDAGPAARPGYPAALLGPRLGAWAIDVALTALTAIPGYILYFLSTNQASRYGSSYERNPSGISLVLFYGLPLAFLLWNWGYKQGTTGQSVGKGALGIKLVRADDGTTPVGVGVGCARALSTAATSLLWVVGLATLIVAIVTERRQRIADHIFNTAVVRTANEAPRTVPPVPQHGLWDAMRGRLPGHSSGG
jgi:uncharacterized RDD family membrane protein YckC